MVCSTMTSPQADKCFIKHSSSNFEKVLKFNMDNEKIGEKLDLLKIDFHRISC